MRTRLESLIAAEQMIVRKDIKQHGLARGHYQDLALMLYLRWTYGERVEQDVDIQEVLESVHGMDRPWPLLVQQIHQGWLFMRGVEVWKKCRGICSEYMKAGDSTGVVMPICSAIALTVPLVLCWLRIVFRHRLIPLRWSVTPIARYLHQ